MNQFDFKSWRESKRLTQAAAAGIIGRSPRFWRSLVNGEVPEHKCKAIARTLQIYDQDRAVLLTDAEFVDADQIKQFINAARENGINQGKLSEYIGGGRSTIGHLRDSINSLNQYWRMLIASASYRLRENGWDLNDTYPIKADQAVSPVPVEAFEHVQPILIDNQPWWPVADVCRSIDYKNPSDAIGLVDQIDLEKREVDAAKGPQWLCNESGLYQLLISTRVPKAVPFRRWVTSEVLPSIRKTNTYSKNSQSRAVQPTNTPDWLFVLRGMGEEVVQLKQQIQSQAERIELIAEQHSKPSVTPEIVAKVAIEKIQGLESKKAELHNVVRAIVAQAKSLPTDDPDALYYSEWQNTWRTVHRHARPPVSKIAGYTSLQQIEYAILGGQAILARLGGRVIEPIQLRLDVA